MRLRRLIPLLLLVFGITPTLVLGLSLLPAVVEAFDKAARQDSLARARAWQDDLTQAVQRRRERARNIALLPAPLEMLKIAEGGGGGPTLDYAQAADRFRAVMGRWFRDSDDLRALAVLDRGGRERLRLEPGKAGLAAAQSAAEPRHGLGTRFKAAMGSGQGGAFLGGPGVLRLYQPIRTPEGDSVGMLTVDYDLTATLAAAADSVWVDGSGRYLRGGVGPAFTEYPMLRDAAAEPQVVQTASGRTAWVPLALGPDPADRLWVGTRLDDSELDAWLATLRLRSVLALAALVLGLAVLARWVNARVDHIKGAAFDGLHRIIAGETGVHFDWKRPDELRQLAHDLTELGAQHSAINADLRRFSEILAHHLQEPVRMQAAYVQSLARLLPKPLDPEVEEAMGYIQTGAVRLRELLRDVQLYLVIDRLPPPAHPVPAADALEAAWSKLAARVEECGATLVPGPLPEVWMPAARLADLFGVLLANALEYRHPDRRPRIRVNYAERGGAWEFAVADNGIGIEPEYTERIFRVFERLHPRTHHAGTGIGLALARKIVECAHGTIRVESTPGEGSTFLFTLPKIPE